MKKTMDKKPIDPENLENKMDTPVIDDRVYKLLPSILGTRCEQFHGKRERDMFLIGSLAVISGSLPNVHGYYDGKQVFPHIYAMVIAPPASGKGVLVNSLNYVEKIQEYFLRQYNDKVEANKEIQKSTDSSMPVKRPTQRRLLLPANSSSAAFMNMLRNSNGEGIIFETEADSLSTTLKNDWGNYSDILRKAYHHEPISSSRVDDDKFIDIKTPKLAVLISGTFDQVGGMKLNDPTNGLQSRFFFYLFSSLPKFKNVFRSDSSNAVCTTDYSACDLLSIYRFLESNDYEVSLTESQETRFCKYFKDKTENLVKDYNGYFGSLINRHALTGFRLIMILTVLRHLEKGAQIPSNPIFCTDDDFMIAYHLMETLIAHATAVFALGVKSEKDAIMAKYMDFYKILPDIDSFTRQEAIDLGAHIFSAATIDRRLKKFKKEGLLVSNTGGTYRKVLG